MNHAEHVTSQVCHTLYLVATVDMVIEKTTDTSNQILSNETTSPSSYQDTYIYCQTTYWLTSMLIDAN